MADQRKSLDTNIDGQFFVDSTCIDCDACRQLAPDTFADAGSYSSVYHQPENPLEERAALRALLACPTGSIGTRAKVDLAQVRTDFPIPITDSVFYCGYNSPKSYGGSSYFIQHADGNWLIDSPKYLPELSDRFEQLGGVQHIFLTHRDDVADAERYADRFGSERIIHRNELSAQPNAERVIEGNEPILFSKDFWIVPTPGHTRGHMALLYQNHILFSGDHLWWSRNRKGLWASKSVCWYSWPEQTESVERLLAYSFDWVLPGHGERVHLDPVTMRKELERLLAAITPNRRAVTTA